MKELLKKGFVRYTCLDCENHSLNENHIKETGHYAKVEMVWHLGDMTDKDIKVWRNIEHKKAFSEI